MIYLYTGVPGSGKSYKMVHDLAAFVEKNPDIAIISNIRDLRLPHTDFENYLDELFPGQKLPQQIEAFFDYEHQQLLNEKFGGPIMYVLDECQLYFPRRMGLPKTEAYLQRHRHLGHFIYLATQSSRLVNSNFIPLIEIEYHAARRTISFFGEIHYKEKSPQSNQIIRSITLRPKQAIFDLYKSFETAEIKKPKPVLFKFFFLPLLLSPFFYLFYSNYLSVPGKETGQNASVANPATDKLMYERDKLLAEVSRLNERIEIMTMDNERMQKTLEEKERVFLPVMLVDGKKMTIDPETNAYVEVKKIAHRVLCVGDGGLNCYFDRPLATAIRMAGVNDFSVAYPQASSLAGNRIYVPQSAIKPANPGGASFVEPELVPEPDKFRRQNVEY